MLKKVIISLLIFVGIIGLLIIIGFMFIPETKHNKCKPEIKKVFFTQNFKNINDIKSNYLSNSKNILDLFYQPLKEYQPLSNDSLKHINDFAKNFLLEYSSEIELLLKNYESILSEPKYIITDYNLIKVDTSTESNLAATNAYLNRFVNVLSIITFYYYSSNKLENALKLSALIWKLGDVMHHNNKEILPSFFTISSASKIKIIAITHLINILKNENFNINFYEKFLLDFKKIINFEPNIIKTALFIEKEIMIKSLDETQTYELYKIYNNEFLGKLLFKIFNMDKKKKHMFELLNDNCKIIEKIFEDNKENLNKFQKEIKQFLTNIDENYKSNILELGIDMIFNTGKVAQGIVRCTILINFAQIKEVYFKYLQSYYYSIGIIILCKLKTIKNLPKNLSEIEQICEIKLPKDYFDNMNELKYKTDDNQIILYSNGFNLLDDNGNENDDIVLLKLNIK